MCAGVIRMLIGLLVLMPAGVFAATIQLPRTGQTACYGFNLEGQPIQIDCSAPEATGQDANKAVGLALPAPPRFTEPATANGTLTDHLTDLVWLKNADCLQGARTWQEALERARTLSSGTCGLSDNSAAGTWRLPNRKELLSLTTFQAADGAELLTAEGFVNGVHDWYWSSDTYVRNPSQKWVLHPVGDAHPNEQTVYRALFVRDLLGLTVTPESRDFGTVTIQQAAPATITLTNRTNGPIAVTGITTSGTDAAMFAVSQNTGTGACTSLTPTLPPAGSCTVTVSFTPASAGAKSGVLRVASNSDKPVVELQLTGTGTADQNVTQGPLQDVLKVYRSIIAKTQLSDAERTAFDVAPLGNDGRPQPNGVIDMGDVVILLRRVIGAISF